MRGKECGERRRGKRRRRIRNEEEKASRIKWEVGWICVKKGRRIRKCLKNMGR